MNTRIFAFFLLVAVAIANSTTLYAQNATLQWLQTLPDRALPDTIDQLDELDIISLRPKLDKQQLAELLAAIANKPTLFYGWSSTDTTLQHPLSRTQYNWQFLGKQQVDSIYTVFVFYITPDTGAFTWTMAQHQVAMISINRLQVVESVVLSDLYLYGGDGSSYLYWVYYPNRFPLWQSWHYNGGCGGPTILECQSDCFSRELRLINGAFTFDSIMRCTPFTYYRDPITSEALTFGCAGFNCTVLYKARSRHNSNRDIHSRNENWKQLNVINYDFDSRVWVVQFPNSATTYTLTFSPDFKRLTSQGSDGSAVQTFEHIPYP